MEVMKTRFVAVAFDGGGCAVVPASSGEAFVVLFAPSLAWPSCDALELPVLESFVIGREGAPELSAFSGSPVPVVPWAHAHRPRSRKRLIERT
jgi:hypothetical protein